MPSENHPQDYINDPPMKSASEYNPYVPTAEVFQYSSNHSNTLKKSTYAIQLTLLSGMTLTLLIGFGFMFHHIETIMASGPTYLVLGLLTLIFGLLLRQMYTALTGFGAMAYAIGVFLTIYLLEWSPDDADQPVKIATAVYGLVAIPLSLFSMFAARRRLTVTQQHRTESFSIPTALASTPKDSLYN